jgi:hypothetical protein
MRLNGQLPIASGIVGILATAVLVAFYVLDVPQLVASGAKTSPLGALNDALGGVQLVVLLPVAARLRFADDRLNLVAAILGVTGMAAAAVASELYVSGVIASEVNYPIVAAGNGLVAVWMVTISLVGRSRQLPRGLTRLGVATGAGILMIPLGVFLLGGLGALTDPKLALQNYPFLATIAIGIVAVAIGLPIWSIWLGRHLLAAKMEVFDRLRHPDPMIP